MKKGYGLIWGIGMIKRKNIPIYVGIIVIILIFVWLIFFRKHKPSEQELYEKRIELLEDSINNLNKRIFIDRVLIDSLKLQKEQAEGTIIYIEKQNEKVDNWIIKSDADANIQFLSDYLSGENDFSTR